MYVDVIVISSLHYSVIVLREVSDRMLLKMEEEKSDRAREEWSSKSPGGILNRKTHFDNIERLIIIKKGLE